MSLKRTYEHGAIERKWQKEWEKAGIYRTIEDKEHPKAYVLDMFPYPSGEGLHVGHPKGYIATDIYARYKRMNGYRVLHPMGWDAFGLPAENFAIKNKINPRVAVEKNIARYKEQLSMIGLDYDWSREITTTNPAYYKWTQWIFLKLFEKGLAYESHEPINWCPSCKTGLANEDLEDGKCERCGSLVTKRPMRQWVLRITDYADRLLKDLDELVGWPEHIRESQRNWIGRSEGAELAFPLVFKNSGGPKPNYLILHGYTGHADTNFLPWLKQELENQGLEVQTPQLPNTGDPKEEEQVSYVLEKCHIDEGTIIVGHSLGGAVAMKVLERLNHAVAGLVLVAPAVEPSFRTGEPRPFWNTFSFEYDHKAVKATSGFRMILSDKLEAEKRLPYLRYLSQKLEAPLIEGTAKRAHFTAEKEPMILQALLPHIRVFTTRPDTLFGATYIVLAPEHPLVKELAGDCSNKEEILRYIVGSGQKTDIERTAEGKEKTGVELKGVKAVNPANGEEIPVFIADYVLAQYGTGAIMAVPAHDERDYAFAVKHQLPVRQVVAPYTIFTGSDAPRSEENIVEFDAATAILKHWDKELYYVVHFSDVFQGFVGGHIEPGETPEETVRHEVPEESGYTDIKSVRCILEHAFGRGYKTRKLREEMCHDAVFLVELGSDSRSAITDRETTKGEWMTSQEILRLPTFSPGHRLFFEHHIEHKPFIGSGKMVNSWTFNGFDSEEAKKKITEFVGGEWKTTYKLRDWVFSRQRYWGEPIPIIHCAQCGPVAVPEEDLPVRLPPIDSYEPTGTGESPLAAIEDWVNTTCPKCAGGGKRETNTMPQWAGSSWYYLRYMDPGNDRALVGADKEKYWAPVDMYVGGAEHATRHLVYARFWHKFLYDIGTVHTKEPFERLYSVGLILASDGKKMSKRYGNVVNPDDVVKTYGADTLRVYEMFMGPFDGTIPWNTDSMIGSRRFIERIFRRGEFVEENDISTLEPLLHKSVKKVGNDIESFKFNTAISQLMILLNEMERVGVGKQQWDIFLKLLAPFAPHLAEELWQSKGHRPSIHLASWPKADTSKLVATEMTVAVQINGKVRATLTLPAKAQEGDVVAAAKRHPGVAKWLSKGALDRIVYIPGRILSLTVGGS